uniref:RNA polymerase n=1 Tax=uncultured marine virus TaxID=186617 RepID=A0A0F7LCQ0_9VIRU|nr:RNA polymerase [uncultured marine virus]
MFNEGDWFFKNCGCAEHPDLTNTITNISYTGYPCIRPISCVEIGSKVTGGNTKRKVEEG